MKEEKIKTGDIIMTYGQKVVIDYIENNTIYLKSSIVVPTIEYTRNYININEIQKKYD